MKYLLIIVLLILTEFSFSQEKILNRFIFDDIFAYEADDELRSLDDMIFRKAGIVFATKNRIRCNNSIFIFETSTPIINFSNFNEEEKNKIKKASNFFNDTIHNLFQTKNTKIVIHKKFKYKIFKMKFKCLYLGELQHSIRKNNKFVKRKKHTYLIYDFIQIIELPPDGPSVL